MHCVHHCLPGQPRQSELPSPKQAGPDGERLRLKDGALYDDALKYCINCKRCEVACPSDVKIGDIIQRARAKYDTTRPSLRNFVLSHTDLMGSVSTPFAPIVNTATSLKPVRQLLDYALKSIIAGRCQNTPLVPSAAGTAALPHSRRSIRIRSPFSRLLCEL